MSTPLDQLFSQSRLWRGEHPAWSEPSRLPSGFAELDAVLPGGGWPQGTLTEILCDQVGLGEIRLVLPALAQLSQEKRWIALVAPPYLPYAPAWASSGIDLSRLLWVHPRATRDGLWAVEQALRSGTCGAVLAWTAVDDFQRLRRLQLAAEAGHCWGVLFRRTQTAREPSPAALRLRLETQPQGATVHLLKRRGAWAGQTVRLMLRGVGDIVAN